jgi:glycosyltransferase involved in cell wall biosynthesis
MKQRRIRVLHVIANLNYGGMERVLSDIVTRCNADRFESHVLCLQYLGRYSEGLDQFAELHVAEPTTRVSMLRPTALVDQMTRIAPDVVHTHSGVWYKASLAARMARVNWLIHTEHGRRQPDTWPHRLVDGIAARRTHAVVAVSSLLADQLPATLHTSPSRVVCIPNGVDTDAYRPRPDGGSLRRALGISHNTPVIGSIGRLEPIKTYDVMIKAFARFLSTPAGRDAILVVAGEGQSRPAIEELIGTLGIRGRVHLLGWRDDVHELHSTFSIFTMSSKSEGTSISLLEAMGAGLPPVVTDVGGNASVLGTSLRDCLVPWGDEAALAEAWTRALAEPRTADLGRLARDRVLSSFSVDAMVRSYEALYERGAAERAVR